MNRFITIISPLLFLWVATAATAQDNHLLDTAKGLDSLNSFLAAVEKAGLGDVLSGKDDYTIFAPNDEAFKALGAIDEMPKERLARVLKNHVIKGKTNLGVLLVAGKATNTLGTDHAVAIEGGGIQFGTANVKKANVECGNGYLNIIDQVLVPASKSLKDVAKEAGLTQFLAALEASGLAKTLDSKGPLTVFAPTDEALKKLGDLPKDELATLLKNHVVPERITVADIISGKTFTTLAGQELRGGLDGVIKVGGIALSKPDLPADNGILHVIEGVIISKPTTPVDHAAEIVGRTVEIGARLYNGKNPSATVDVYQLTLDALLRLNPEAMPPGLAAAISDARGKAAKESTDAKRAWALRKGLDTIYKLLAPSQP